VSNVALGVDGFGYRAPPGRRARRHFGPHAPTVVKSVSKNLTPNQIAGSVIVKSKTGLAEFNIRESSFRVALACDFKLLRLRQSVSSGGETGQERVKC
jgi:hypothetical protein